MYDWALNAMKFQRAIAMAGTDATEETVLKYYRDIGGLVDESQVTCETQIVDAVVEDEEEPVKKVRKVSKKK